MLMLGAVLVSLIIQGRRQEKKQAATRVVEVIKQYKPTPTRILAPQDLEVIRTAAEVAFNPGTGRPAPFFAVIRNKGTVAYSNANVELNALGKDGHILAAAVFTLEKVIPPGAEVHIEDAAAEAAQKAIDDKIREQHLNPGSIVYRVRSAEIAPAPSDAAQK